MQNQLAVTIDQIMEFLMPKRTNTKPLKFVTTNKIDTWSSYEIY